MFENLTNKFEEIFSSLKKVPSLDEKQVDEGLRNIRQALLEADVSLEVAKEFITKVKPKALGQDIVRSTSPGQMVVKIVYDELVNLLGLLIIALRSYLQTYGLIRLLYILYRVMLVLLLSKVVPLPLHLISHKM